MTGVCLPFVLAGSVCLVRYRRSGVSGLVGG